MNRPTTGSRQNTQARRPALRASFIPTLIVLAAVLAVLDSGQRIYNLPFRRVLASSQARTLRTGRRSHGPIDPHGRH